MHRAEFEVMAAQNRNSILSFRFVSDQWMSWFTPKESLSASQNHNTTINTFLNTYYQMTYRISDKVEFSGVQCDISVGLRSEHLDVLVPGTSRGATGNVAAAPDLPAFSADDARTTCPLVPPNPKEEIEAVAWCRKKAHHLQIFRTIILQMYDVHDGEPKMHANAKNIKLN